MKRNVLTSFTNVLLLPVTIVPRAVGAGVGAVGAIGTGVGAAIGTGVGAVGTGVVQGIAMLNPQRWVGNGGGTSASGRNVEEVPGNGYESFGRDGALFEVGEDEDDVNVGADADVEKGGRVGEGNEGDSASVDVQDEAGWGELVESRKSGNEVASAGGSDTAISSMSETASTKIAAAPLAPSTSTSSSTSTSTKGLSGSARTPHPSVTPSRHSQASPGASVEALDLFLSLDISLQLIHATRDPIKRLETFAGYPGTTGTRVRETLDDTFCEMLRALGSRHIAWGFGT